MKKLIFALTAVILLGLIFSLLPPPGEAGEASVPILIEQKIVQVNLQPEFQDGINWDLLKLFLRDRDSTTGMFPYSDRARNRLDFRAMKNSVPSGTQMNADFETVKKTRMDEFNFGAIWEDTRNPAQLNEDLHFGSLRIYQFQPVMTFLRTMGKARVLFSRKWISKSGEQSMISSRPELLTTGGRGGPAAGAERWEGSHIIIKPRVIKNNRISFHLDSEIATVFMVDPATHPGLPVITQAGSQYAALWRLFRLNTLAMVESGQTSIFEDIREGQGVLIFITPYILENQRKILRD